MKRKEGAEPRQQGRTKQPAEQDAERAFQILETRKGLDMRKFKTKVITEESQVPHGFRRISSLADSLTDQKKLSDAHTDGFIAAVKLMRSTEDRTGPVWVDAEAAREVLAGDKNRTKKASTDQMSAGQNEAAVIALCEINNGMSLIHATLERLTAAVESIATQPKRDPLEEFANDNGFHDTLSRAAH